MNVLFPTEYCTPTAAGRKWSVVEDGRRLWWWEELRCGGCVCGCGSHAPARTLANTRAHPQCSPQRAHTQSLCGCTDLSQQHNLGLGVELSVAAETTHEHVPPSGGALLGSSRAEWSTDIAGVAVTQDMHVCRKPRSPPPCSQKNREAITSHLRALAAVVYLYIASIGLILLLYNFFRPSTAEKYTCAAKGVVVVG